MLLQTQSHPLAEGHLLVFWTEIAFQQGFDSMVHDAIGRVWPRVSEDLELFTGPLEPLRDEIKAEMTILLSVVNLFDGGDTVSEYIDEIELSVDKTDLKKLMQSLYIGSW